MYPMRRIVLEIIILYISIHHMIKRLVLKINLGYFHFLCSPYLRNTLESNACIYDDVIILHGIANPNVHPA